MTTFTKRSPKAAQFGMTVRYELLSGGHWRLWVTGQDKEMVWQCQTDSPEAAFSRFYSWMRKYEAQSDTAEPAPDLGPVVERLDRLIIRLDALLDRADAIFAHADAVLRQLS